MPDTCKNNYESAMNDLRTAIVEIDLICLKMTLTTSLCGAYPNSPALWSWKILQWEEIKDLLDDTSIMSKKEKAQIKLPIDYHDSAFALSYLGTAFAVITVKGILLLDNSSDYKSFDGPQQYVDRFIAFSDLCGISEDDNKLAIDYNSRNEQHVIRKTDENAYVLSCIAHFLYLCAKRNDDCFLSLQTVESVLTSYLDRLAKDQRYCRTYMRGRDSEQSYSKKLSGALKTYASNVKRDDVAGFIDDSVFRTGKSGILFGKEGFAFAGPLTREYLMYREIENIEVSPKGNEISFLGSFSTRKGKKGNPSFLNSSYDFNVLKRCLIEIITTTPC